MASEDLQARLDNAIVVAIGGNVATPGRPLQATLQDALDRLAAEGLRIWAQSAWWISAAWPDPDEPPFLNAVVLAEGEGGPAEVLAALHRVETVLGRRRGAANAPRTVDLDLIAYGRRILDGPGLILPHPRAAERAFVMRPLAQIAPTWVHPAFGETALALAGRATVGDDARPA